MSQKNDKYYLKCRECGAEMDGMQAWFDNGQQCTCGNKWVDVKYNTPIEKVKSLIYESDTEAESVFHYFDFLPLLNKKNIVTRGEGTIPVERWKFLSDFAKKEYGIDCEVNVYRNDQNQGTGTFKDVAASVSASVLKEHGIKDYAVASTGNIANAFAHYLAEAGTSLAVFIPTEALKANEAEVSSYGQRVFRVNGDYAKAKAIAAQYSKKYNILLSGGNTDPMRVEAKKTMVFEWLRQMNKFPTVYIQALSGGTGPIAIDKAYEDTKELGLMPYYPRYIMVQGDGCAPMAHGWDRAVKSNFAEGWQKDYPIYESPKTIVPTLATGNPATYPIISSLVKKSNGAIIEVDESKLIDGARWAAYETSVRIGPASAVAFNGFLKSLRSGLIKNGDVVLINTGEGVRRAPEFMEDLIYTTKVVDSIDDCTPPRREDYKEILLDAVRKI